MPSLNASVCLHERIRLHPGVFEGTLAGMRAIPQNNKDIGSTGYQPDFRFNV
jgi:hypothetical protein